MVCLHLQAYFAVQGTLFRTWSLMLWIGSWLRGKVLHLGDGFQGKMMTSFCHSFKRACLFWIASNSDQLKCWNVPKRCSLRASTHKGWRLHHNYSVWRNVYGCLGWHVDSVLVIKSTIADFYDPADTSECLGLPFCK